MLNVAICGINGAMGKRVYEQGVKEGLNIVCGIDKLSVGNSDCPVYKSFDEIRDLVDVIIDFSSPSALTELLKFSKENKIPLVIATTGYDQEQEDLIKEHSKTVPVFKSANTSLGVNLILKICSQLAKRLNGFDVEIIDKHHKNKNDSPSGTSLMIYDAIASAFRYEPTPVYGRRGKGKRKPCEIGIHAVRGGTTVGQHEINFFGENESITITHTAHSKDLFASGAISAVKFIVTKKNGLFTMNDLLE